MTPHVSVCIPVYQAADHLQETLDSVWHQSFEDFEVIAVDDGSSDGSWEILAAQSDPRLRAHRRDVNRGQEATVAETISRARGELVKFLDADDLLHADCLAKMAAALDANPRATFAFSRREVLAAQPEDEASRRWIASFGELQTRFEGLAEVNEGSELLHQYLRAGLPGNWIAEPAGVMARRADLLAVGGYNRRVRQDNDMDLWVRLMGRGTVVFLDEALYTYRLAFTGVTGRSASRHAHWLDPLWIVEGLVEVEPPSQRRELSRVRWRLLWKAGRRAMLSPLREPALAASRLADLLAYGRFRAARGLGRARPLHEPIPS